MVESGEFLRRVQQGAHAREQLLRELYPELLRRTRIACRRGGLFRADDIEDVFQDVCVMLLTKWQQFRGESSLWTWVWSITANRVRDHHRFLRRFDSLGEDPAEETSLRDVRPSAHVVHRPEHEACVEQVLNQLAGEGRARKGAVRIIELLEFTVLHGSDTSALAQFLGCGEGAAKERKRYALQKLRELCLRFCGNDECAMTGMY